jgi:hypothetical protein
VDANDFVRVIEQGRCVQQKFAELGFVAVGGTAAALHCAHRFSMDVDCVSPHLQERFEETADSLEHWEGWTTNRLNPPVLILGQREGVELGLRQQRRAVPLVTTRLRGLLVPTLAEMLRVKAFLLLERRATRDYVDVAALVQSIGEAAAVQALSYLNAVYRRSGAQTVATRFAESCEAEPVDLAHVTLTSYKGLQRPFNDWRFVAETCRRAGRGLLKRELEGGLPAQTDAGFSESGKG